MALTDKAQRLYAIAGGKAREITDGLADPGKRATYVEAGRAAVSQGTAFVTDKTATARTLAGQGWSRTTRKVEDILTPPPVWDNTSKKAKLYAAATSTREQAKTAKNKGVALAQEYGPKVVKPARRLTSKVAKTSQEKAPVARGFASRNRDEIFLALAVVEVIVLTRKIQRKRRGNKK